MPLLLLVLVVVLVAVLGTPGTLVLSSRWRITGHGVVPNRRTDTGTGSGSGQPECPQCSRHRLSLPTGTGTAGWL
eukprot:2676636-Rhodomonas_salina.2